MTAPGIPVWVAGCGGTAPAAEDPRSIPEMVLEAVQGALADAALTYDDIDAVVTASVDLFDGLTASNIAVTEVVGAVMKPETRISSDALGAVIHAACQIRAGAYRTVLVAAHGKASLSDYQQLTRWALDPIHLQPLELDFLACSGLQARQLLLADSGAEERWAGIASERRGQAAGSGLLLPIGKEEVLASPFIASPLREGMAAPMADGACAVVLRGSEEGEASGAPRITGIGHDLESHAPGERNLTRWDGLERAFQRAARRAGIEDAATAFDLAEPSCLFPHEEELFVEATGIGSDTTISPDGGLFAGAVPIAAGLFRLIAAAEGLSRGGGSKALVHGAWGPAGQGQAVVILEGG